LILCPCHGSIYDPANHAAVRRGPSDRALPGIAIADGPNGTIIANGPFDGPIGPQ
jgi:Rieske Fe-S protein